MSVRALKRSRSGVDGARNRVAVDGLRSITVVSLRRQEVDFLLVAWPLAAQQSAEERDFGLNGLDVLDVGERTAFGRRRPHGQRQRVAQVLEFVAVISVTPIGAQAKVESAGHGLFRDAHVQKPPSVRYRVQLRHGGAAGRCRKLALCPAPSQHVIGPAQQLQVEFLWLQNRQHNERSTAFELNVFGLSHEALDLNFDFARLLI